MTTYNLVACFTGDCCNNAHLWQQTIIAKTFRQGAQKLFDEINQDGRIVSEILNTETGEIISIANL